MAITAEDIQKLREMTGAGVMDTKRALTDAKGDFEAAKKLIQERGLAKMEKRAGRETGAGMVHSYIHNGRIGVLLEVRAETDFVVRSEPFQKLAHELAMQIAALPAGNVEELLEAPYIKDESRKVKDIVGEVIGKVGENVKISRFYRIEI
ncbi:MAG TPA: translation elongation factor Ts [Candidatus Paceibacterota bacterium]|nr:translation elongation factor Ts [Candidatus Paceibacterota bacterium]